MAPRAREILLSLVAAAMFVIAAPPRSGRATASDTSRKAASQIAVGGGTIEVTFGPGDLSLSRQRIIDWVSASACAVRDYYGRFPVRHLRVLIVPVAGRKGVVHGTSDADSGAFTRVFVGQFASEDDLKNDWILTHEMVHLAFPSVGREHHWIEEGIATYVEPIARMEAGNYDPRKVWGDLVDGLPKGLPQPGDEGLDHTHTWGRTYWGGALFCLLADVEIRERTANRYGLRDALRGIVAAGGNLEVRWPLTGALKAGDEALGVNVLTELYERMKATPVDTDLPGLWRKLGVAAHDGTVTFDDRAPLASVRRAIAAVSSAGSAGCTAKVGSNARL